MYVYIYIAIIWKSRIFHVYVCLLKGNIFGSDRYDRFFGVHGMCTVVQWFRFSSLLVLQRFLTLPKPPYFIKNGKVGIFLKVFKPPTFFGVLDGLNIWTAQKLPIAQTSAKLAVWRFQATLSIFIHPEFCTFWHSSYLDTCGRYVWQIYCIVVGKV